jgi:hypothetical protein
MKFHIISVSKNKKSEEKTILKINFQQEASQREIALA